jgi:hypothetical protein
MFEVFFFFCNTLGKDSCHGTFLNSEYEGNPWSRPKIKF